VTEKNLDATGPYIWLRYATQYSKDGQTHTLEMSVPVPLGASMEQREKLFREAEAGMNQLANRFGQCLSQTPQCVPDAQVKSCSAPMHRSAPSQQSGSMPASMPVAQAAPRLPNGQGRELALARSQESVVAPMHPNIGVDMPMKLGPNLDSGGNLPLPEFIHYISENLNLTPRQAMEMLKVRSLSTGINLREALERLRYLVAQRNAHAVVRSEKEVQGIMEPGHPPVHREAVLASASPSLSSVAGTQAQLSSHTPEGQINLKGSSQQVAHQSQSSEMPASAPVRFDEEEDPEDNLENFHLLPPMSKQEEDRYAGGNW
jgi:hypothetical protein